MPIRRPGAPLGLTCAALAAAALTLNPARATDLTLDVTDIDSLQELGDIENVQQTYFIGAGSHLTNLSWSTVVTAFDPSWLSDITVSFSNTAATSAFYFSPAYINHDAPGVQASSGSFFLPDFGADITVDADGLLHVDYFEAYDDPEVAVDGHWDSGTITLGYTLAAVAAVPEPSTCALMLGGLGVLGWLASRRRPRRATPGAAARSGVIGASRI